MATERTIYCDGPGCEDEHEGRLPCHVRTATPPPYVPKGFIETRETDPSGEITHQFCGWDCLMKFAAAKPLPEVIEWGDIAGEESLDGD